MHFSVKMRKPLTVLGMVTSVGAWGSVDGMICSPVFQFFPYILLLVAILLYLLSLFWDFAAAPHVCSGLKFVMEGLNKVYNHAVKAAKSIHDLDSRDSACPVPEVNENMGQTQNIITDKCIYLSPSLLPPPTPPPAS
ncbi:hypothetical protein FD754_012237 [Muntiacus muntjak]|uniref:Uncharacterized protein n=1 Tax=Muntiacus muntjak TaxID=9888 RepID=A0A5N3VDQ0_MUNMU|nr:hypothetical protein FD754_012237 [Muntiacus muntjak]